MYVYQMYVKNAIWIHIPTYKIATNKHLNGYDAQQDPLSELIPASTNTGIS